MNATSNNCRFSILGGGGAAIASVAYASWGIDSTTPTTPGAWGGSFSANDETTGQMVTGATGTGLVAFVKGVLRITTGGTIIPSVALANANAAVVGINSYFRIWPVGNGTVTTVGNWT